MTTHAPPQPKTDDSDAIRRRLARLLAVGGVRAAKQAADAGRKRNEDAGEEAPDALAG